MLREGMAGRRESASKAVVAPRLPYGPPNTRTGPSIRTALRNRASIVARDGTIEHRSDVASSPLRECSTHVARPSLGRILRLRSEHVKELARSRDWDQILR